MKVGFVLTLFTALLALAPEGLAFEIFPEFHTLTEKEESALDPTTLIDSEYQSNVNTYQLRQAWDAEFFSRPNGLNFTIGSLSNVFFLEQDRLRLSHRLLPSLEMRFTYFQERDLTTDQSHAILELVQELKDSFAFSLYGEPSFYKRENTLGAALLYFPSPQSEIRLFHTWVSLTRNEHNDQPDYFVRGSEPTTYGLVGRHWAAANEPGRLRWLEYFVRRETSTLWRFPQGSYDYAYEAFAAGVSSIVAWDDSYRLHFRFQAAEKFEGYAPLTPASSRPAASLDRRTVDAWLSWEWKDLTLFGSSADLEAGLGLFERRWQSGANELLAHRSLTPIAWLRLPGPSHAAGSRDMIALGYDATLFTAEGNNALASPELKYWTVEHRANLRYTFSFPGNSELGFLVSADLDALARGASAIFEGGQGEFKTFF